MKFISILSIFKDEVQDEDSDLIAAARSASSTSTQRWNSKRTPVQSRRNVITTMSPNRRDSTSSPNQNHDRTQVQFIGPQGTLMTSLPAHLVLEDRPSR